jgi:hypothetical protein
LTLFYRWERKKNEREKKEKYTRKYQLRRKLQKEMMAVLLHIYTMQWCYVGIEELGASTTLFFSLLSLLCCWGSGVFDTWAWVVVLFSFFSSTCADEMKKKKKRIRRSKWVLVTLSGLRANNRWLMLADFRILFHYICASPLFRYIYLSSPAVSPFSFRWQVEVVAGALLSQSDPITAFIHPRTQVRLTSVTANVMVKKELHRHPYLYISSPASRSMRVYTLLVN